MSKKTNFADTLYTQSLPVETIYEYNKHYFMSTFNDQSIYEQVEAPLCFSPTLPLNQTDRKHA